MGCCFSSKRVKIKVMYNIKKGNLYNYLRYKRKLILSVGKIFSVTLININFNDCYVNSIRLWTKPDKGCYCFHYQLQRTSLDSPSLFSNNYLYTAY